MLAYEFPVADGLLLRASTDFSFRDEVRTIDPDPFFGAEDYWLVNARLALAAEDDQWEVALWSRNIEDAEYDVSNSRANDFYMRTPGMGNTYGLSFSYNWM